MNKRIRSRLTVFAIPEQFRLLLWCIRERGAWRRMRP